MEGFIFIAVILSIFSVFIAVKIKNRKVRDFEHDDQPQGDTRWGLIAISLIPGFFIGALMAGFYEGLGVIENSEAFSPSFFIFVSIGSILSYFALDRIFKR